MNMRAEDIRKTLGAHREGKGSERRGRGKASRRDQVTSYNEITVSGKKADTFGRS